MDEIKNKTAFMNYYSDVINNRNDIVSFRENQFVEVLNKFDGKVYNKRFCTALKTCMPDRMFIKTSENVSDEIIICKRNNTNSYIDYESLYIKLVFSPDGRISAAETLKHERNSKALECFREYTEKLKDSIKNYDAYLKQAEQLQNMIDNFSKLPNSFRENVSFSNKFYLR